METNRPSLTPGIVSPWSSVPSTDWTELETPRAPRGAGAAERMGSRYWGKLFQTWGEGLSWQRNALGASGCGGGIKREAMCLGLQEFVGREEQIQGTDLSAQKEHCILDVVGRHSVRG